MSARFSTLLATLGILIVGPAWSQPVEPFVEITLTPEEVAVGEPVSVRVSVFVPSWFVKPPVFPSLELPNAVTRLPADSTRPTRKRFGRDMWSGISRKYEIFPLIGARFRLENQAISLQYANPGGDPLRASVDIGELIFRAYVPEGARELDPYIAGTRLEIKRDIEGNDGSLEVGDAVVVTYTAELNGLSSMFLPEIIDPIVIPGVSVYPDQPVVEDTDIARRTERLTYIFNAGGDFEIPAVSMEWWNRDEERIEIATLPAIQLNVAGPLLATEESGKFEEERNWWAIAAAVALFILLGRLLWQYAAKLYALAAERKQLRIASEPFAWERVRKALGSGDAQSAHDEIVVWLHKLAPGLETRSFAANYGDDILSGELEKLNRSLYASFDETADLRNIAHGLSAARKRCLEEHDQELDVALPPLNP